ncbi:uncharacterized protein LOC123555987 [Mercenaria mercenaria]|uniref:uncharacterized protein LOC123555987 n=1 Tax=Mercenaria mercenaria TaxID=6596 RepID=UPI00234E9454|nr:uncharacterized protein LOC123555987 [Mercenaria mercenaria]
MENSYAFKEGTSVNITCQLKDNPNWKALIIGKVDDKNIDIVSQIFTISNLTGSVVNTTFDNNYTTSYILNKDGALISLELDPVTCENEGLYMCAAIVGELESPIEINNASTTVNISTESKIPEITIPDKIYLGREAVVECTGLIGKGESGQIEGRLILETNFGDNGSNVTYNASDTPEEVCCYFKDSISVQIPTATETSDLWAQCVVRPLQGDDLSSGKKEVHFLTSFVAFGTSSYIFNIGEKASITCDVVNIPDWKRIEIRRSDGEVVIGVNSTGQSPDSNKPHIRLMVNESNFANNTATLAVVFDAVMCSDAMGEVGDINYTCAVMTSNSTTEDVTTVTYQRKPEVPILEMSREIIENKYTLGDRLFYCKGDVGDPPGTIEVQSNFNGSYETFLAPLPGIDNNTIGWIVSNEPDSSECKNYKTLGFAFHNVTIDMQYKHLRCTIRPSDKLTATMDDLFDDKPINIVSEQICVGKAGYVSHPYFCHLYVECDKTTDGHIVGVPMGCSENECFDDAVVDGNPCVECSSIGGCNITGIKCDKTYAASYKGGTVSFTCDTQDFGEVTHISVNNYAAFAINVTEMTIPITKDVDVKVSEGSVILSFSNVSCNQEGDYAISLNNQTAITHSLVVISEPAEPNLSVPDIMTVNQETAINCSGRIGRDKEGNNKAVIYLEVMQEQSSDFEEYSDHETRASSEEDCEISESVVFSITPDVSLNNSQVRCTAKNDTGVVTYSSPKLIVLQTPAMFCEPVLQARDIGESVLFICALKDITNITSVVVTKNYSTLINENNVALPYKRDDTPFTLTIPTVTEVNMTFTTVSCEEEGDYDIMLNDAVSATLTLRVVSPATKPSLNKSSKVRLNERLEISCSGDIGRDQDGNAATNMFLEVKFMNESEFSIYNESVEQDPAVLENCRYTQTVRLIFYPDVGWNNSEVRCAARNETNVVQSSTIQAIKLDSPNMYFETTNLTGIVGESVILTCIVDGVDGLTGISITKGTERIIVASYPGDSNSDSVTVITEESNLNDSSGVLMINMTVQCGDDGDYFCTPSGLVNPSEDRAVLSVQWKALATVLDPSSDMVENSIPWAGIGFETVCTGELGSQNASIYLESNVDGEFKKIGSPSSSEFKLNECSNLATVNFNNKYTADWNGTVIRCVIETEEEKLMDAEYVTVVPETLCNGLANGIQVPHPFDCRAWFTCGVGGRNITALRPNKDCQVDECYDVLDTSKCIPCDNVGKCRRDPLEEESTPTTTTTPSPNSTYMVCGNLLTGAYDENMEVTCSLNNIDIDLSNLTQSSVTIIADNSLGLIFDSSRDNLTSNSFTTATANEIVLDTSTITLKFVPLQCQHIGIYTFKYSDVEGSSEVEVVANVSKPALSKQPDQFYRNQEVQITCSVDVGRPKGSLALKVKESGESKWTEVAEVTKSENETAKCTTFMSVTHVFYISGGMEGHQYICEATGANNDILESNLETIEVSNPVVYFMRESETVQIGSSLQLECVIEGISAESGAILTRNSKVLGEEHVCNISSSGIVACSSMDTNGIGAVNANNNLTAVVTINPVRCEDEGTYYCQSVSDSSLQASFTLSAIKPPSGGVLLSLPTRMVLNLAEYSEKVTCDANVGYPAGEIRIEYSKNNFESYDTYNIGTKEPETELKKECSINKTVSYKEHTFTESWNNTDIRCAVYNHTDVTEPMLVSDVQRIKLIENECPSTGYPEYYHPFNCHYYIRCSEGAISVSDCGSKDCPNFVNTTMTGCTGCSVPDC